MTKFAEEFEEFFSAELEAAGHAVRKPKPPATFSPQPHFASVAFLGGPKDGKFEYWGNPPPPTLLVLERPADLSEIPSWKIPSDPMSFMSHQVIYNQSGLEVRYENKWLPVYTTGELGKIPDGWEVRLKEDWQKDWQGSAWSTSSALPTFLPDHAYREWPWSTSSALPTYREWLRSAPKPFRITPLGDGWNHSPVTTSDDLKWEDPKPLPKQYTLRKTGKSFIQRALRKKHDP